MVLSKCSFLIRDGRRDFLRESTSMSSFSLSVSFNGGLLTTSIFLSAQQMKNWTNQTSSKGYALVQVLLDGHC